MVKNFFDSILYKIKTFFTGERAKGQPANYPTIGGQVQVQSTCMPEDKTSFNEWVANLEKVKTGK